MMTPAPRSRKTSKPHWYLSWIGECPVCGRDMSYKERMYGKRPDPKKTHLVEYLTPTEAYCGCMEGREGP